MRSMTGYGSGEAALGPGRLTAEVRSLNHRYLELRVRLPTELNEHTFHVEQTARSLFERGRYDVGFRLEGAVARPRLSTSRLRELYASLSALRDELAPGTPLPLAALLSAPQAFETAATLPAEEARVALDAALRSAAERLTEMREREGASLRDALLRHLARARELRATIGELSAGTAEHARQRLQERLARLLGDRSGEGRELDAGRLEQEIALLADRSDVTEELTRLDSHFDQLAQLCAASEPVGRRLDFLLQELGREANTIGSKSQDARIAHQVVELKAETERIREQVQNVE